jgi:hypothetical protein
VAGAQAAAGGKPMFNSDANGAVLDLFAGSLDTNNPMAGASINLRNEQAGQAKAAAVENYAQAGSAKASAANSYASADQHRANTDKIRKDMERDARSGDIKEIVAPDGSVYLVNKLTGESRVAIDSSGRPVISGKGGGQGAHGGAGGAGGAGGKIPAEVHRMNIALRSLDDGLNQYEALLKDFNPRNPGAQMNPTVRAKAESLVADLQMQLKEAQALGALTGPDIELLSRALANPVSLKGAIYGRGGLGEQLSQTRQALARRKNALAAEFNRPDLAAQPQSKVVDFNKLQGGGASQPSGSKVVDFGSLK